MQIKLLDIIFSTLPKDTWTGPYLPTISNLLNFNASKGKWWTSVFPVARIYLLKQFSLTKINAIRCSLHKRYVFIERVRQAIVAYQHALHIPPHLTFLQINFLNDLALPPSLFDSCSKSQIKT